MKIFGTTRKYVFFILMAGILGWLIVAIFHPFEPRYQGKRLSAWAKDILNWEVREDMDAQKLGEAEAKRDEALEAIRHIGTKALPLALKYCRAEDSRLKEKLINWMNEQEVFEVRPLRDSDYQQTGVKIFEALGTVAKPAIPSLIKLLQKKDQGVFGAACNALYTIGPDAIPPLITALTNANERMRLGAAITLGGFEAQARTAVPALIRSLGDESAHVRATAAMSLGEINQDSDLVIPALVRCLKDKDAGVRQHSAIALGHIGKQPEVVVPALFARLEMETNVPAFSPLMVSPIARFGTNAKPWSPVLVKMIESNRFGFFANAALGALKRIDPEAAEPLLQQRELLRTNALPRTNGPPPFYRQVGNQ